MEIKKCIVATEKIQHVTETGHYISGLTEPSDGWKKQVMLFENDFKMQHGSGLDRERKVVARFEQVLKEKYPSVCPMAIKLYAKLRTIIRIRHLNRLNKVVDNRKSTQKMSKWVQSGNKTPK